MSSVTAERLFQQIVQLPPAERIRLRQLLDEEPEAFPFSESSQDASLQPRPMPDSTREFQWLAENAREYAGQWVALDGDRLIANSPNHDEVWARAEVDGANLPLITRVPDPSKDELSHPVTKITSRLRPTSLHASAEVVCLPTTVAERGRN